MLVELLCLLIFTIRLVHYAKVIPRDKFWKDPKNICIIVILLVGGANTHHQSGRRGYRAAWVNGANISSCVRTHLHHLFSVVLIEEKHLQQ